MDSGIFVSAGVVLGSVITRLITSKYSEAQEIRHELREDVVMLQKKIDKLASDLDDWKIRYFRLADENVQLKSRCKVLELEVGAIQKQGGA